MHLPVRLALALAQSDQKQFAMSVIPEDRVSSIPRFIT
jgi:hypothetical protein